MLVAFLAATAVLDIAAASETPGLSHLLDSVGLAMERKLRGSGEGENQHAAEPIDRRLVAESIDRLVDYLVQSVLPPNTTKGRRLSQMGDFIKKYVDRTVMYNDDSCKKGVAAKDYSKHKAWSTAKVNIHGAVTGFSSAHDANLKTIEKLRSLGDSSHAQQAADYFSGHITQMINGNRAIAHQALDMILDYVVPGVVAGLMWLGKAVLGFIALFVQPALPPPIQPPISPQRRSFLVAAAGLVTMFAAITAVSCRWGMLKKQIRLREANKVLAPEAELSDTD